MEEIGKFAFGECINLISITIPENVKYIRAFAFFKCKKLKSVTLSNTIKIIEKGAFSGCDSLTSVTISKGVKKIDFEAFSHCKNLSTLIIENPDCEITSDFMYDLFICLSDSSKWKKVSPPMIVGYKNSTAQQFAKKYNYRFKAIEDRL